MRIWREARHVLLSIGIGGAAFGLLLATGGSLLPGLVGRRRWKLLAWVVRRTRQLAAVQRRRIVPPVETLYAPLPVEPGDGVAAIRADPATRRDLAWLATQAALAPIGIIL